MRPPTGVKKDYPYRDEEGRVSLGAALQTLRDEAKSVTGRDIDIWINQRFTSHLESLSAGATVRLSLWDFWDLRGDRLSAGGFWRVEEPTPVRLVQLQLNDEDPLVGLVTILE